MQKNNKKLFGPVFNSSFLNKTPSKYVEDEDIIEKNIENNLQKENESQNEKEKKKDEKEEDLIQKILQLSKKEFEEISTKTHNIIIII